MVKHLPAMRETQVRSLGWEDPLEKEMATPPVLLPRKFHGWRSLVGYSPWGHRVGHDLVTEQQQTETHEHFLLCCNIKKKDKEQVVIPKKAS